MSKSAQIFITGPMATTEVKPTGRLRWFNGVLQQEWEIITMDPSPSRRLEWRNVPAESECP